MSANKKKQMARFLKDRYFWYVAALAVFAGIFAYAADIAALSGLASHEGWELAYYVALHRFLFLVSVAIAAWRFGVKGGLATCFALGLIILSPFIGSVWRPDAWLEIGVFFSGILLSWLIGRQGEMKRLLEESTEELRRQAAKLNLEITERKHAEAAKEHLFLMLRAILNVNQLIAKEKNRDRLLKSICDNFIKNRGCDSAWIALLDESGRLITTAESGWGKNFLPMVRRLKQGELPDCGQRALQQSTVVVTEESSSTCTGCPLMEGGINKGAMTIRLEHNGKVYGLLSANIPVQFLAEPEECSLFEEVAGDVAFALHDMELEEERKRAEHDLNKRVKEIKCLYGIADLAGRPDITLDELCQEAVNLLPPAWQYPEITCARITIGDKDFKTDKCTDTGPKWKQSSDIKVYEAKVGEVEVYYLEERPELDEGPFLKEEMELIDAVAERVGRITEHKRMEEELIKSRKELEIKVEERTAELAYSNTVLVAVNKELEAFSYSVSHDLRAPLRSIDGFSQALLEEYSSKLDEQGKGYLQRVRSATERIGLLIDDMLSLSRITRSEMKHELVDLSSLVQSITENLQETQPERRVEFIIAPRVTANGDVRLLHIMLENLLGNAWKFTGNRLNARIEFGVTQIDDKKTFFIRDNGAGFDMTYADKLFGAFQRLHTDDEFSGTGIGLATVQRIINRHGGRVRAEGEVEKGATFYFTLD